VTPDSSTNSTRRWRTLADEARNAVAVVVLLTIACGVVFPALVIGIAQLVFPGNADGSLIYNSEGRVVGSKLIGQNFTGAGYFHPRPSGAGADGYDASSSSGRNFAPSGPHGAEEEGLNASLSHDLERHACLEGGHILE
jgi:K+-transporting ATPase ATPase C chain